MSLRRRRVREREALLDLDLQLQMARFPGLRCLAGVQRATVADEHSITLARNSVQALCRHCTDMPHRCPPACACLRRAQGLPVKHAHSSQRVRPSRQTSSLPAAALSAPWQRVQHATLRSGAPQCVLVAKSGQYTPEPRLGAPRRRARVLSSVNASNLASSRPAPLPGAGARQDLHLCHR